MFFLGLLFLIRFCIGRFFYQIENGKCSIAIDAISAQIKFELFRALELPKPKENFSSILRSYPVAAQIEFFESGVVLDDFDDRIGALIRRYRCR